MAFEEDFTAFFDTVNGFAESVTYGASTTISAIFDTAFFEDRAAEVGIDSSKPACLVRTSEVPGAVFGDRILRSGVLYRIVDVQPDGKGLAILVLEKQ